MSDFRQRRAVDSLGVEDPARTLDQAFPLPSCPD